MTISAAALMYVIRSPNRSIQGDGHRWARREPELHLTVRHSPRAGRSQDLRICYGSLHVANHLVTVG